MSHVITFHKGQAAPEPIFFTCEEGQDPEPAVMLSGGRIFPVEDGDRLTTENGVVVWVEFARRGGG